MEDLLLCNEENVMPTAPPRDESQDPVHVIRLMARREVEYGGCDAKYIGKVQRDGMEESWRRKIVRWMFETGTAFDMARDTVGCAVYIMDQYLSTKSVNKVLLQLVSMVSMYIASKMHEHQPISMVSAKTIGVDADVLIVSRPMPLWCHTIQEEMELLSQRKFTRQDIRLVEAQLLKKLGWRLNPPSCFMFARDFIHVLDVSAENKDELERGVMQFLQAVVEDYGSLRFCASSVGMAAVHVIWNARRMRPSSAIQDAIHAVDVAAPDFVDCYRWLRQLHSMLYEPQLPPRFVSVEESKTTDAGRSISPTGVDDAAAALDPDDELPAELLVDATLDTVDEQPQRKRARVDSH